MIPVPAKCRWLLLCLLVVSVCPAAAFSVSSVSVSPSGDVYPGDPVNVSVTVYAASGTAFPSYDDLQFVTELDDPVWSYTIIVNGVENVRPPERGKSLTLSGFELNYQNKDEVIVKTVLRAHVPATAPLGAEKTFITVQELDARSYVISSSVVEVRHLVGQPTPTPTPAFGSIAVTSEPSGATVYLDNAIKGITPVTLDSVPNGEHTVLLRLDGYSDFTEETTVMGDQPAVSAVLNPKSATISPTTISSSVVPSVSGTAATGTTMIPQTTAMASTGTLSVTTEPPGAIVYIDGEMKGITPATIPGLTAGTHTIRLILDGYEDFTTTTEIPAGTTSEFMTGLAKRNQAPGFTPEIVIGALVMSAAVFLSVRKRS